MQNGVTHESFFYWNEPYVTPSYFGVSEDGSDYARIAKKVKVSDYITTPENPEKEKRIAEETEMAQLFDSKA
jgi:hypothetical protein